MTERRANDLSYGHLGEASYNIESGEWHFLLDPFSPTMQQILPLRSGLQSLVECVPSTTKATQKRTNWLVKYRPDTFPARPILASLAKAKDAPYAGTQFGQLVATGNALDTHQTFGRRRTTILATTTGDAGHVLRLIRPQIERHEWGRRSSARLSLLDAESPDQGYWVGIGGRIFQVAFAEDETCLAIRQANATTIFKPVYGGSSMPALVPNGYPNPYPSSRLSANPVAVLTAEQTGSKTHADVAFNPWYSRQFVVVDDSGSWTIWDIEGRLKKGGTVRLMQGKRGNIYDEYIPDATLKPPDTGDGWHRILWAGSVSTLVVCNRRHVAMFDVKAVPARIPTENFFTASNSDWILDMKRSPSDSKHLFILTSSRIFWLHVTPTGDDRIGDNGYKVILSVRHFRDANDKTMRLSNLNQVHKRTNLVDSSRAITAISSLATPLINIYTFAYNSDGLTPTSCQGSLILSADSDDQMGTHAQLHSLHILEVPLKPIPHRPPGPESEFLEQDVKFFQVLATRPDFGLSSGLLSMQFSTSAANPSPLQQAAPTLRYVHSSGFATAMRVQKEPWIVTDEQPDDEIQPQSSHPFRGNNDQRIARIDGASRLTINFKPVYQFAFNDTQTLESSLAELLETTMYRIRHSRETEELAMSTLLELSQLSGFTEDLEQAAPVLYKFLTSLKGDEDPESKSELVLSTLTQYPGVLHDTAGNSMPELLRIYDQVAAMWIAHLPRRVSGLTRLAKFQIARKVAVELYLSSIGISMRHRSTQAPSISSAGEQLLASKSAATSRAGSPALFSSQMASSSFDEPIHGLPTPSQTPSLYSQSHASVSEHAEDPAITRLRQYTSITSKPDLGTSKILSHWPVAPGIDPATYSWEEMQKKVTVEESGEERDPTRRREAARRKRRTERSLSGEGTAATEAYSQPGYTSFGSQPDIARFPASSQAVADDVPMTQPNRGAFGNRSVLQGKKKQKKKRAAGFR